MELPNSIQTERVFLASLIKYSDEIPEYLAHLHEDLCYNDTHKIIISAIKNLFESSKSVDVVRLCEYISNIGLANSNEVDIPGYIKVIVAKNPVRRNAISTYFRDLYKYYIARKIHIECRTTVVEIKKNITEDVSKLVSIAEDHLSKCVTSAIDDDFNLVDLYDGIASEIEREDTLDSMGAYLPFPTWNRWWGPLTIGDLTVIVSPPKAGKSTILSTIADVGFLPENNDKNIKVLYLDTELETHRVRTRKVAAYADVNESYIKNRSWKQYPEMAKKVRDALVMLEERKDSVKHLYVANIPIDRVCSIVRRWAATETEKDDFRIVIYDYLKLTGEKKDHANLEWQILGEKCDTLKHLCSEVDAAGIAAVQSNLNQEVAASQRIKWFASNIIMFRKKTADERSDHGPNFGTHIIYPFELRNQGPDWDAEEYVKTTSKDGVLLQTNYLNIEVKNFHMEERGTLDDVNKSNDSQFDIDDKKQNIPTGELL